MYFRRIDNNIPSSSQDLLFQCQEERERREEMEEDLRTTKTSCIIFIITTSLSDMSVI